MGTISPGHIFISMTRYSYIYSPGSRWNEIPKRIGYYTTSSTNEILAHMYGIQMII